MQKNIFVIGLDDFNYTKLRTIHHAEQFRFHPLFYRDEIQGPRARPIDELLKKGEEQLRSFSGSVDAIVGYWDFPVSDMVPFLSKKFGLAAPSLESTVKCEHKAWCRIEQRKVIPEHIPDFHCLNPFDDDAVDRIGLTYPYWLKPIKATDSQLGFKIKNRRDLDHAIRLIRKNIFEFAEPFNYLLRTLDLPEEISEMDGHCCIAEKIISGRQCTVEGYVHNGEPFIHGIIDSFRYPGVSSFFRYQYPSRLPAKVKREMEDISKKVIRQIGLNNSAYNIEFFFNEVQDALWLLEINPRISQSHSDIFEKVDGASNHEIMLAMGLGEKPDFPFRKGKFKCAAKFYLRVFEDGVVTHVPTEKEIRRIQKLFPGTLIDVLVQEGDRLSELPGQDSYSYILGHLYMGARDTRDLRRKFTECRDLLPFRFAGKQPDIAPLRKERMGTTT